MSTLEPSPRGSFEHALAVKLVPVAGNSAPLLVCMAGIPGAGKTTFLTQARAAGRLPVAPYWHDPDRVMEALPGYAEALVRDGRQRAHDAHVAEARDIADGVLFPLAVKRRVDIIMDMGFARPEIMFMVESARAAGYRVETYFIYCDPNTALERCRARSRHVPDAVVAERQAFLAGHVSEIAGVSDMFRAYDNRQLETPFKPLGQAELAGLLRVSRPT